MSDGKRPTEDGLGGLLSGINDLANQIGRQIGELAQKGQELGQSGQIGNLGDVLRHLGGFTVGTCDEKPKPAGPATVREVIEPPADVFEESDQILVLAEMPGIVREDVRWDLKGDILEIAAESGRKKYRKLVRLPAIPRPTGIAYTCRNGVLEVKLPR